MSSEDSTADGPQPKRNVSVSLIHAITILVVIVTMAAGIVLASEIVLILFLGVLFGIFLCRMTRLLERHWPVGRSGSLAAVVSTLLLLTCAALAFFFVQINRQIEQASDKIEDGIDEVRELVGEYPTVRSAIASVPFLSEALNVPKQPVEEVSEKQETGDDQQAKQDGDSAKESGQNLAKVPQPIQQVASSIGQLFRTTFGLVVNSLLIFFVGLFIAVAPNTYRDGIISLVPLDRRQRAGEVLDRTGHALWRWLIGRFGSMVITGVGAYLILLLIGVSMAGTLGILTGLLTFVPNIGSAVALMLSVLVALPQGVSTAIMVVIAYLALQLVESYVVTPLIQQKQVSLPPALLIAFQAVMGVLFGFLGAAVASPVLVAAKTAIEMLYIEDWLGDKPA